MVRGFDRTRQAGYEAVVLDHAERAILKGLETERQAGELSEVEYGAIVGAIKRQRKEIEGG
jgi:hypothetical protein